MNTGIVTVIVGAGPGLGAAIARAFAATGSTVVMLARNLDRLAKIAAQVDGSLAIAADATDEAGLRQAFHTVRAEVGDPAVLVHNPSIAVEKPLMETPLDELMGAFALTAGSLLVSAQEVVPAMRSAGTGCILTTGSSAALTGSTWSAALAAEKAAIRNLTFSMAQELEPDGIRVATITIDGILGTPGFEHDRIAAEYVRLTDRSAERRRPWEPEIHWPQ